MDIENYNQAQKFLTSLDHSANSYTFQTFDDDKKRRSKTLIDVLHGTLEEHYLKLKYLNSKGACVSVSVQPTDSKGRKKQNIIGIRSVFFENDNGSDPAKLPLKPSIKVNSSPGKWHLYYKTNRLVPISPVTERQWRNVMKYMIANGSDQNAADLTRALRLPGFRNNKYPDKPVVTLDSVAPIEYEWDYITQTFKLPDKTDSKDSQDDEITADDFFNTKPRQAEEPFRIAKAASALKCIDPDVPRETWFKIGMALHYASGASQEAYDLYHKWSRRGDNYNQSDWPTTWDSFGNYDGNLLTIQYLFRLARKHGWKNDYNPDLKGMERLIQLERRYAFEYINSRYGYVRSPTQGLSLVSKSTDDMGRASYELLPLSHCETMFADKPVPTWGNPRADGSRSIKMENLYKQWRTWPKRRIYKGLVFRPSADIQLDRENFEQLPDTEKFNTYLGLTNPGKEGDWSAIERHIWEVWARKDDAIHNYILNWLARMYQYPGEQGETCLILRSDRMGAGKNIITEALTESWGRHGATLDSLKRITGQFNSIMSELVLAVFEEAMWTGGKSAKSFLHAATTGKTNMSEKKFHDLREIFNFSHIICLSNDEHVVPIEPGDRRYVMLDCDNRYAQNFKYFNNLHQKMKGGETDGFIWHLRHRDIHEFNVRRYPRQKGTVARAMEFSLDSVEAFFLEALDEGSFSEVAGIDYGSAVIPIEGGNIIKSKLYELYSTYYYLRKESSKHWKLASKTAFGMKIKKIFPVPSVWKVSSKRGTNGSVQSSYKFGGLYKLRKLYDHYLGAQKDWVTDEEQQKELDRQEEISQFERDLMDLI